MLVSHRWGFIFLKTTKTAGTSVEISLSRYLGPDDVITPISPADEEIRRACGGRGPQHHDRALQWREHDATALLRWARDRARPRVPVFWNHMPAATARAALGDEVWTSYLKFAFVRNPWDRVVSHHFHRRSQHPDETLAGTIDRTDPARNYGIVTIDGAVAVDVVGRYERLADDLHAICARIGLDFDGWLPQAKSGFRPDRRPYRELYRPAEAERVAQACAAEIACFGYEF